MPAENPSAAYPNAFGVVPSVQSAPSKGFARPLAPTTQNLTAHVLRTKGVPETDIAEALGNPVLMQQLINQNFGPDSAGTPAKVRYAAFNGNASGGPSGHADQRVDPGNNRLDDDRARPPPWGRFTQSDPFGYTGGVNRSAAAGNDALDWMDPAGSSADRPFGSSAPNQTLPSIFGAPISSAQSENSKPPRQDKPVHLAQMFAFPPVSLFARPPIYIPRQLAPLEELPSGSSGGPKAGLRFPRKFNDQQPPNVPCTYCGKPTTDEAGPDQLNGDHIIPRAQGGNAEPENFTPACRTCNLKKRARTPRQWYEGNDREGT